MRLLNTKLTTFSPVGPVDATEMRPQIKFSIVIFTILFSVALAILVRGFWNHESRYSKPFIQLQFYQDIDSAKPFYSLYIADATDADSIVPLDGQLTVKHDKRLVEVRGRGRLQYRERMISSASPRISINGHILPPEPPQAVLRSDGQIVIGAFLRNFE